MSSNIIVFVYSLIFIGVFLALLIWRINLMKKMNISIVNISDKKDKFMKFYGLSFFALLIIWSGMFIFLSLVSVNNFLFQSWWNLIDFPLLMILSFIIGGISQLIMWLGIFSMGKSWRIGIDKGAPGELVTEGIFKISRNPIFFGLNCILIVAFILHPNLFFLSFAIGFIVGIHFQILKEEKHLLEIYGNQYDDYKKGTKRYFIIF